MPPGFAQAGKGGGVEQAGLILLAIWLIIEGLRSFMKVRVPGGDQTMGLLALLAGILLLLGAIF